MTPTCWALKTELQLLLVLLLLEPLVVRDRGRRLKMLVMVVLVEVLVAERWRGRSCLVALQRAIDQTVVVQVRHHRVVAVDHVDANHWRAIVIELLYRQLRLLLLLHLN